MITTHFNQDTGVLEITMSGEISLNQLMEYILMSPKENKPQEIRTIVDCRNAEFQVEPESIEDLAEAVLRVSEYHISIINAVVLSSPHDTAVALLFQERYRNENFALKIFSTYTSALEWIKYFQIDERPVCKSD